MLEIHLQFLVNLSEEDKNLREMAKSMLGTKYFKMVYIKVNL